MSVSDKVKIAAIKEAYRYLDKDPETNIPKLIDMAEKFDRKGQFAGTINGLRRTLSDPNGNWMNYIRNIWRDVDPEVRKRIFTNFAVNATFLGQQKENELAAKYDCNIPWAIQMDPTSACNLRCTGCWAAEYGHNLSMTLDELENIIEQGKALGCYFYIYSGGEPTTRKKDLITLCERHPDCQFLAFTNGTLIDEAFADELLRVKNFVPAISVEGFEEATDFRRGQGTFQAVMRACAILREKKLPFGYSLCYTSKNYQSIGSEAFFDALLEWGGKFAWFFTYMPVGNAAAPELMVTPEQRAYMYHVVRDFRKTKPLFTMDFWNDGEYAGGCIAGGRKYLHISAGGDYEPCGFIHYANMNVRDHTLLEALQSPIFMAYHRGQPFNDNQLRPCPLLDNYGKLAEMVKASGAHSTDMQSPEDVDQLCAKCRDAAAAWAPVAEDLWETSGSKAKYDQKHFKV